MSDTSKTTMVVACILLISLLLSLFLVAFDARFYHLQYLKQKTYVKYEISEINLATQQIIDSLRYQKPITSSFFNEKEKNHMVDVGRLFLAAKLLLVFAIILLIYLTIQYKISSKVFLYSSTYMYLIIVLSSILLLFFKKFFYVFHLIFFRNNDWVLDPRVDNMINLFPLSFFISAFVRIMIYLLILSTSYLVAYYLLNYYFISKRSNF